MRLALLLCALAGPLAAYSPNALPEPLIVTPKLGVALSGGGPRGRAHLGVLKALHELRVPVDLISGTSAGSLVGGLYAQSLDLDRVATELDQLDFLKLVADEGVARRRLVFRERERQINYLGGLQLGLGDDGIRAPQALSSGRRLRWILRRLTAPSLGVDDFRRLPVPFRAAATDLTLGQGAVIQHGDLAEAILASASVPGVFAPLRVSGSALVDGLIFSNLPVDAAREAQRMLVVDITQDYKGQSEYANVASVLGAMIDTMITQNTRRQRELLSSKDLVLRPQLDFIGNLDYHRSSEAVAVGYQLIMDHAKELQGLRLSESDYQAWFKRRRALGAGLAAPKLSGLRAGPGAEEGQLEGLGQRVGEPVDYQALEETLEDLMGTGLYEDTDYRLLPTGPGQAELVLDPRPKRWGISVLDLGLKLSSDFVGRSEFELLLQVTQRSGPRGRQWRHQVFLGRVNGLGTELTQPLTDSLFLAPHLELQDRVSVLPGLGSVEVQRMGGGLDLGLFLGRCAELRVGWLGGRLWSPQWGGYAGGADLGLWQALLTVDTLDDPHFPTHGLYLRAQAAEARGSLQGPGVYDVARLGLHHAFSLGSLVLILGGDWQQSFGSALPIYEEAQQGGFLRLGGYRQGHFSGSDAWLARAILGWRVSRPQNFLAKTVFYGLSFESGETGVQPWAQPGGETSSMGAYLALDTLLGPFYLAHARNFEGGGVSYVYLGNPF